MINWRWAIVEVWEILLWTAFRKPSITQSFSGDLSEGWEADAAAGFVSQYGNVGMNNGFRTRQGVGGGKAMTGDKWYW